MNWRYLVYVVSILLGVNFLIISLSTTVKLCQSGSGMPTTCAINYDGLLSFAVFGVFGLILTVGGAGMLIKRIGRRVAV
jgi:hypothetical protein